MINKSIELGTYVECEDTTLNHLKLFQDFQEEIYVNKKMKPICSKLIFKQLLYKLTTECTF